MFRSRPLSLAILLAVAPLSASAAERADLLIRNATVVDVEHASTRAGQSVVIRGEDIVAVGPDAQLRGQWSAARQIDAKGKYLIPGLWDMHVHFGGGPALIEENKALLPLYIAHGITTVRDCSGDLPGQVLQWRGEIAKGTLFGPRLLSSGAKIEGIKPVWKGTIEVGSQADVDQAITRLQHDKVDFVKITDSTLTPELFLYAAGAARKAGFKASGHIPVALTVEQAVDAGLASIEHPRPAARTKRRSPPTSAQAASTAPKPTAASMPVSTVTRRCMPTVISPSVACS